MKKLQVFLFLFLSIGFICSHAQGFAELTSGETISVFTSASQDASQRQWVEEHFVNPQEVYFLHYSKPDTRTLDVSMAMLLPMGSRNLQLVLHENPMDFTGTTSCGKTITPNRNIRTYHGFVKGVPRSLVAVAKLYC